MSVARGIPDAVRTADPRLPASDSASLDFANLVDVPLLQSMMDDFYDVTHIPMALIDPRGHVIVGAGWQDACTQFHRVNPETCAFCIESDTLLTLDIPEGESRVYQCKNGMWDAAMPVFAGNAHLANVFTGQFFFEDTPIDIEFFRTQAQRYGFDEDEYLAAICRVPRLSRAKAQTGLSFLTKLAAMISELARLALENARLYAEEHNIAETLQETLVVLPSQVPGVAFSRSYESATSEAGNVGGDFVDVFEISDGIVGIVLGDVSGKGVEAAVTTSVVRTSLRVYALDDLPPAQVASKTNRVMQRFSEADSFVTLWFGILNTRTGLLRYISAGHPPAFVASPDGAITSLKTIDPILGAFNEASYFESQTVLAPGERLILYSDGITEARSPQGDFLGEDGLLEVIEAHQQLPTPALSQEIMRAVREYSAGVLRDDAAILAIEPVALGSKRDSMSAENPAAAT